MKRVLLKSALALCAIALAALLVAAGVLFWAVRSESGMQFVWQRVAPRLPAGVSVATVEGRLSGPIVFGGVVVQTATLELRVERVEAALESVGAARSNCRRRAARPARRGHRPASRGAVHRAERAVPVARVHRLGRRRPRRQRLRGDASLSPESERGTVVDRARELCGRRRRGSNGAPRARRERPALRRVRRAERGAARRVCDERSARLDGAARRVSGSARQHAIFR